MKRAKATQQEKKVIKEWLQNPFDTISTSMGTDGSSFKIIAERCPFFTLLIMCRLEDQPYCKKFFPTLKNRCPCQQFPFKYVQKVARELIKNETS